MDLDEIKALIEVFAASDLAEMEFSRGDWTLRLVRAAGGSLAHPPAAAAPAPAVPRAPAAAETAPSATDVRAPVPGVVYLSAAPGGPPFVAVGRTVAAGDVVAVVEAMKVFNEIRAERGGTVAALHVTSGAEVDAGQLLMRIE